MHSCRRRAAAGDGAGRPAAVLRPAPRRPRPASSAAAPAGCGRARSAAPTTASSSSTSSRCSAPTSSRRCGSRWRAGRSRSPAARRRPPSRPAALVVLAAQPVPVRQLPRASAGQPLRLPRGRSAATTAASSPGPIPDRVDIMRHVEPAQPHERDDLFAPRSRSAAGAGPGRPRPGSGRPSATPAGWRLNAQAPGPLLRERLAARRRRPRARRQGDLRRSADPARRHPGAPARLDGRRPARCDRARARPSSDVRAAAAHRRAAGAVARRGARGMSAAAEDRPARPGRAVAASASPATCG